MSRLAPPLAAEHFIDVIELQKTTENTIQFYRQILQKAEKKLQESFNKDANVIDLVRTRAWYVELIILHLWQNSGLNEYLCLVAVGGFGRGDLHPYSDVDILLLKPNNSKKHDANIQLFIQNLWDIGLDIGSGVRTAKECFEQAKEDVTIATSLMEARFIIGQRKLFFKMQKLVSSNKIWKAEDFYQAKIAEQKARHKKFSDTTYNVEPNIKEGLGGLRDIQMVSWVVQRFFQTQSLHELVDAGFLTEYEYIRLKNGQNFLWKVRFALHCIAGHKEERIGFDYQLKLAKVFGFHDEGKKNPAVEQFMQLFYRNAMRLERLNARLLQLFNEKIIHQHDKVISKNINRRFRTVNNFLEIIEPTLFATKMSVWFELFILIQKHPHIQGVRADTVRAMRHNIKYINQDFRDNPQVKQQFLEILQQDNKVAAVLNHINRLGILARYLPVFGRIVGRMQFDLFHIYTVDQHSLFALRNLCLLRHGKTQVKSAAEIFSTIAKPYLVYIAALFHDIAKGREGHHADLGAQDAQQFCQQHHITSEDAQLVTWLVKEHLLMSETAQKQDISDPKVIARFSQNVGSLLKLKALYLLTIADISATDPKLWNSFKESLLYELYIKSKHYLTANTHPQSLPEIQQTLTQQLSENHIQAEIITQQIANFPKNLYFKLESDKLLKVHYLLATNKAPITSYIERTETSTEFIVYCQDFKGLFYIMVSILEKYDFNVADASINNTENNYALNTVHCIHHKTTTLHEKMMLELKTALAKKEYFEIAIEKYTPPREKVFKITPQIKFLQSGHKSSSLIEVICRERHGLLPLIAKTLIAQNISIRAAKIVTVGARAEYNYWLSQDNQALTTEQLKKLKLKLLEIL